MKTKLFMFLLGLFLFTNVNAQAPSYTDFEWDILRLGYSLPSGDALDPGLLYGGELRYNLKDNLSIGFGLDVILFDFKDLDEGVTTEFSMRYGGTIDYYLSTTSANRAFVGLGFGQSSIGDIRIESGGAGIPVDGESSFTLTPRVGYEFGHLRLMADYNLSFKEAVPNYFNFSAALTLWGGYKG